MHARVQTAERNEPRRSDERRMEIRRLEVLVMMVLMTTLWRRTRSCNERIVCRGERSLPRHTITGPLCDRTYGLLLGNTARGIYICTWCFTVAMVSFQFFFYNSRKLVGYSSSSSTTMLLILIYYNSCVLQRYIYMIIYKIIIFRFNLKQTQFSISN